MRLLITRPAGDAQAAADELRAKGHAVLACPLIEIEKAPDQKLNLTAIQGFLVTDGDGARALAEAVGVRTFPVFCDSAGTAAELTRLGFKDPRSADGDASTLARLIERSLNPKLGGLVYVCSNAAPINLSAMLNNMGFAVRMAPLYDIKRADALPQLLTTALLDETLDAAVFFSADEARAFAQLVQRAELDASVGRLIAIVAAPVVAAPLTVLKFARVVTAQKSDALSVMAMVDDTLLPQPEPIPEPEPAPVPEPEFVPEPVIISTPEISAPEVSPPAPEIVEPETFESEVVALDEPQPESTPEPPQEIIDVPESEEEHPTPERVPDVTPHTEDAAPKKNRFASLGTFMQRFKPSTPAAASEIVTEAVPSAVAEPTSPAPSPETVEEIPVQDDVRVEEEPQAEIASAPEVIPEVVPEAETAPTIESAPEPEAASEPIEEPAPEEPISESIVSEPIEEPQATEDVTAKLPPETEPDHDSESRRPPPREGLFKKFAAFIARRRDEKEKEIPNGFAVQEPVALHVDETPPAEPVVTDDAPETLKEFNITPDAISVSVPPEPEPTPEPTLEPVPDVAPEPEPAPEPVAPDPAPEIIDAAASENAEATEAPAQEAVATADVQSAEIAAPKPSLWAKASVFMGRLHAAKRENPESTTPDETTPRNEDDNHVSTVTDDTPPIPEILSAPEQNTEDQRLEPEPEVVIAADEPPAPTQAVVAVSTPEPLEPEPLDVVVSPSEIEALTSQAPEAVDVPELTPEPVPAAPVPVSEAKQDPEPSVEIFTPNVAGPEIFDQADDKNPTEEVALGTMPPAAPPPGEIHEDTTHEDIPSALPHTPAQTTFEPAAIQESISTPMAAESNDITQDTSESLKPTIGAESGRGSRSGGRAARLLAEDAADARAINQRFKVGGADTPEPESISAEQTTATSAPRAAASSRGIPRFVPVVIVLGVLGAAAFYSTSWITPQLESLSKSTQTPSPSVVATPEQLTALQSRADTLAADVVALNARLNALEQRPAGTGTDAEAIKKLNERLAALETSNTPASAADATDGLGTSVTNQARQLANVTARVATLEAAIGNIAKLEDLATRLTSLEGKSAEANSVLALADRLSSLEKRDAVAATALVLATAQLRDTVAAGKPYAMELETVSQLATRADVAFNAASLKDAAAKGLVRDDALKNSFASAATQAVRAGVLPDTSAGWFRRALDRVYGIVSLRPFGSTEGTTPGAIVARAELALNNDNLPGAVAELETLTGASLDAITPWLAQAKARVAADQALDDISARSVGAMSAIATPQSPVAPGSPAP